MNNNPTQKDDSALLVAALVAMERQGQAVVAVCTVAAVAAIVIAVFVFWR